MSKRRQQLPGDKLPLPQPRSPRELDEKILAYAQQQAQQRTPQKTGSWLPGWSAGLATASVVAIALFITETRQPAPALRESAQDPAELQYSEKVEVKKMADEASAPAASRPGVNEKLRARKMEMLAKKRQPEAAAALATEQAAQREVLAGVVADSSSDSTAASPPALDPDRPTPMDDATLQSRLRRCAAALEQGQQEQAQAAYQALRRECPACELPETLEQWLSGQAEAKTH